MVNIYELAGFVYSAIAGVFAGILMLYAIEKKSEKFFVFSLAFLIISWSGIEWSLWLYGQNLFELVFAPIVPLSSYFVLWSGFVIYTAEKHFKRRDWVGFLIAVGIITLVAHYCMNCLFSP